MLDIEAIPTEDLLSELTKRCAPAVFVGTKYNIDDGGKGSWESEVRYCGQLEACRGLLKEADAKLERQMIREEIERSTS